LVAAGQSYKYNSTGRGPGYLPSENINNVKIREDLVNTKHIVEADLKGRQLELYSQVDEWPADKGDIIEYYEKYETLE